MICGLQMGARRMQMPINTDLGSELMCEAEICYVEIDL